jgi:hypothetical protein
METLLIVSVVTPTRCAPKARTSGGIDTGN